MRKYQVKLFLYLYIGSILFMRCTKTTADNTPGIKPDTTTAVSTLKPNPFSAPLYWSVYEYHIIREQAGIRDNYIPEDVLKANIDWIDVNLKSYGYKMICMDGWGDVNRLNENGYRKTHSNHWIHDFAWWSKYLQDKGMTLGIYCNPLWIHVSPNDTKTLIKGTNIPVSTLINSSENALWFKWIQVDNRGAEEYVKGYVQYYADMGIKYLRVDFLSWFETGKDRYMGTVGPSRPQYQYIKALKWMREACDANGMFLSLVMPNLSNEAEVEKQYGHMIRINEDTGEGTWYKFSNKDRGQKRVGWSVYANAMDGLTYWSYISGKNKMILDPDFLRINTFSTDDEKKSVVSACLMAGSPITIADQFDTIGQDIWVYQNAELLTLNQQGFVGKPLSNNPTNELSQIWKGQLQDGTWIIGLFNRESTTQTRNLAFTELGFTNTAKVRDLWEHKDLGSMAALSVAIPAHGCVILKISN